MKKKGKYSIYVVLLLMILVIIFSWMVSNFKKESLGDKWAIYFAPTYTQVSYGDKNATLVEVDSDENIKYYNTKAYPFSGMVNYKDDIVFQEPAGLNSLKQNLINNNIVNDINTVGYNMANTIKEDKLFYFLLNECYKDNYYSSKLIIGDGDKQSLHQIKGFIQAYGNDNDNIYLFTSDMKNRYSKQIQKISINSQDDINIEINNVEFDTIVGSDNKMIINGEYIYCFAIKEGLSVSLLKISINTLEVEEVLDLIKFDSEENQDNYYPISVNSIFLVDNKIYYPTKKGEIYSFNIENDEFKQEFSIKDYDFAYDNDLISYYDDYSKEIDFLYFNNKKNKYCIYTYDLNGNLKNSFYMNELKIKNNLYPHSFIKKR